MTEHYRCGIFVFQRSVGTTPTGTAYSPTAYPALSSVHPGSDLAALIGQIVVALLRALPAVRAMAASTAARKAKGVAEATAKA